MDSFLPAQMKSTSGLCSFYAETPWAVSHQDVSWVYAVGFAVSYVQWVTPPLKTFHDPHVLRNKIQMLMAPMVWLQRSSVDVSPLPVVLTKLFPMSHSTCHFLCWLFFCWRWLLCSEYSSPPLVNPFAPEDSPGSPPYVTELTLETLPLRSHDFSYLQSNSTRVAFYALATFACLCHWIVSMEGVGWTLCSLFLYL